MGIILNDAFGYAALAAFFYADSLYRRLWILHRKPENGKIMKQSEED